MDIEAAYREAYRIILKVAVINIILGVILLLTGFNIDSIALIAFSADKLLDSVNNVLSIIAIYMASKRADKEHQYGHGKFEVLARFFLSMILFISMFQILVNSIMRLFNPKRILPLQIYELAILLSALAVIISTSVYMSRRGTKTGVKTLTAESYNYLGDTFSMIAVIAGMYLSSIGLYLIDPLIAILIAGMILRLGWKIFKESIDILTDRAVIEPIFIEGIAKKHKQVREVDEITSRSDGVGIFIEFTLRLDPNLSLEEAHDLAHIIEREIKKKLGKGKVRRITIHIEPYKNKLGEN